MKKFYVIGAVVIATVLMGAGCDVAAVTPTSEQNQASAQQTVANTVSRLTTAVPIPTLNNSLERANIAKRLTTFDDPNKVSYIYLISYGRVMTFYTIKGKVTSGNKRLSPGEELIHCDGGEYGQDCIMQAPELDGTYGSSAPYVFFWTTDNVYVQWSGDYMLVDEPLQLSTQPELIRSID